MIQRLNTGLLIRGRKTYVGSNPIAPTNFYDMTKWLKRVIAAGVRTEFCLSFNAKYASGICKRKADYLINNKTYVGIKSYLRHQFTLMFMET